MVKAFMEESANSSLKQHTYRKKFDHQTCLRMILEILSFQNGSFTTQYLGFPLLSFAKVPPTIKPPRT